MADIRSTHIDTGGAKDAALNYYRNRLVTVSTSGVVHLFSTGEGQELWQPACSWNIKGCSLCKVCWAHPSFGNVLAIASFNGSVTLWREQHRNGSSAWSLQATLTHTSQSISDLQFAPPSLGLLFAAASKDGHVRLYKASRHGHDQAWQQDSGFIACQQGPCFCLSWQPDPQRAGVPLLAVGSADGAKVWAFREACGDWVSVVTVHKGAAPVTCVDWAPSMGRPQDLLAVSCDSCVTIYGLEGPADNLQVEQVAQLDHAAPVCQLNQCC
ncbi:hypothetical protein WJX73_002216 [Symbiochloris irregularis]|uniref:Uncharacterized protein n=1 Tax=Symbiochloris irregularis TaxID=706552 RepID=A0AAW1PZJ5_9CHLO